jgi:hypothetical protein
MRSQTHFNVSRHVRPGLFGRLLKSYRLWLRGRDAVAMDRAELRGAGGPLNGSASRRAGS